MLRTSFYVSLPNVPDGGEPSSIILRTEVGDISIGTKGTTVYTVSTSVRASIGVSLGSSRHCHFYLRDRKKVSIKNTGFS